MQTSLDTQCGDDFETVVRRIAETIAWCAPRADILQPKNCLRSLELAPHPLEDGRKRVVRSVAGRRFIALGRPPNQPVFSMNMGRLLIYEPDVNLAHGLEESETRGYVDINNTPPWDTWIAYIYEPKINYLPSWVPKEFVRLVAGGIAVSPEVCFRWLNEEDCVLNAILRERGLQ